MGINYPIHESRLARRNKERRRHLIILIYTIIFMASVVSIAEYRSYLRGEAERQAVDAMLAAPGEKILAAPVVSPLPQEGIGEEAPGEAEENPADPLPDDILYITGERRFYQDQDLTLIIPKLGKTLPIYSGVTQEVLKKGVGLYDYAQLPGEGNRNVSVAGHRNTSRLGVITDKAPFYYIDTLKDGDYLYLTDNENIYRYLYEDTIVVEADNWGPIYRQGYSCLTITSCTPIGISTHRIVVRGRLDEIFALSDEFEYIPEAGAA